MAEPLWEQARDLLSEQLRSIRAQIGPEAVALLRQAHDDYNCCAARNEGQSCCIDYLVGDAEDI